MRRVMVRTGIVLAPGAGALEVMTPIFKMGPGTPIGGGSKFLAEGKQWMSWIHIDDIVGIFRLAVENAGPGARSTARRRNRCGMPNSHGPFRACCASRTPPGGFLCRWARRTVCCG